mgnify:CR=1 FL=1
MVTFNSVILRIIITHFHCDLKPLFRSFATHEQEQSWEYYLGI